jgi:hypothetical protein
MGNEDLRAMARGRMDSSGYGLTQVGRVLGMVNTVLWVAGFVVWMLVMAFAVVAR